MYYTIDGERVSVFEDEMIESFTLPDYPQYKLYGIDNMVFTGLLPLNDDNRGRLPMGCAVYSGVK